MITRYSEHRALNLFSFEASEWQYPLHKHSYFEFIFIREGQGRHHVNGMTVPYKSQSCFLLTPEDEHEFLIEKKTHFTYIKFTEVLLQEKDKLWQSKVRSSLKNINSDGREIINDEQDRETMFSLLSLIEKEYNREKFMNREILLDLFSAMLLLVVRNVASGHVTERTSVHVSDEKIGQILAYLREHLTDKEKTGIEHLAAEFNLSPTYVSEFFKKHTGESIQQFLIKSKLKIAERLLKQSNDTISQIAAKLGFNDTSHFSKLFSAAYKVSPGAFKKEHRS